MMVSMQHLADEQRNPGTAVLLEAKKIGLAVPKRSQACDQIIGS